MSGGEAGSRPARTTDAELLDQQRRYYRARAPEYDEWWQRRGRYERGPELRREWEEQVAVVEDALDSFSPDGDVLELAGGTGWWTERLARSAERLTVVDSSPEALMINRRRVGRQDVAYLVADVFSWEPPRAFDVVFFSFWLSHVPRERFGAFWSLVRSCLAPDGRIFLIDNRLDTSVSRADPYVIDADGEVQVRRLNDGSEHHVVKVFYEPDELTSLLSVLGWSAQIDGTRWFIWGTLVPSDREGP